MQSDPNIKTLGLSVVQWHEMVLGGADISVRFKVNGTSMRPLIRKDRDIVTVVPLRRKPRVGDIVLFIRPGSGAPYVLHRIWKIEGERVCTFGDGCFRPDPWMPVSHIWGFAVSIERGPFRIDPNSRFWQFAAKCWAASWAYRKWLFLPVSVAARASRFIRRKLRGKNLGQKP